MGIFDFLKKTPSKTIARPLPQPNARALYAPSGTETPVFGWGGLQHIDAVISMRHRHLVLKSREAFSNNAFVKRYVKMTLRNVIGSKPINPQFKHPNVEYNQRFEAAFKAWGKKGKCDLSNAYSWLSIQRAVLSAYLVDGESLLLKAISGNRGFALQLLDAQRIPPSLCDAVGNVVNGIRFDQYGAPVAYYCTKTATPKEAYTEFKSEQYYQKLDASNVIHVFTPDFVNQKRGIPATATSIESINKDKKFTQNFLDNATTSAKLKMWLEDSDLPMIEPDYGHDAPTQGESEVPEQKEDTYTIDLRDGNIPQLPPGMKISQTNIDFPASEIVQYHQSIMQEIASGLDTGYASLANDGAGMNFSTMRSFALDDREEYMVLQEMLIEHLCTPVLEAWLDYANLLPELADIPTHVFDEMRDYVYWQAKRWAWVDPTKDSQAIHQNMRNFTTSVSQAIRDRGADPDDVIAEIGSDLAKLEKAGIPKEYIHKLYELPTTPLEINVNDD
jgi:lambda family phage portal protein